MGVRSGGSISLVPVLSLYSCRLRRTWLWYKGSSTLVNYFYLLLLVSLALSFDVSCVGPRRDTLCGHPGRFGVVVDTVVLSILDKPRPGRLGWSISVTESHVPSDSLPNILQRSQSRVPILLRNVTMDFIGTGVSTLIVFKYRTCHGAWCLPSPDRPYRFFTS